MEVAIHDLLTDKRVRYNEKIKKEKLRRSYSVNNVEFATRRGTPPRHRKYQTKRRNTVAQTALPKIVVSSEKETTHAQESPDFNNNVEEGLLHPSYALDAAVASNDSSALQRILSVGNVALNTLNASGGTAMHEAAFQGKVECLQVFLNWGVTADIRDKEGWTPLHAAVCGGDVNAVTLLIRYGADLEACTNEGVTPLGIAIDATDKKMVKILSLAATNNKRSRVSTVKSVYCE